MTDERVQKPNGEIYASYSSYSQTKFSTSCSTLRPLRSRSWSNFPITVAAVVTESRTFFSFGENLCQRGKKNISQIIVFATWVVSID